MFSHKEVCYGHKCLIKDGENAEILPVVIYLTQHEILKWLLWWFKQKCPHRLLCLIAWLSISGTIWEGLENVLAGEEMSLGISYEVSEVHDMLQSHACSPPSCSQIHPLKL